MHEDYLPLDFKRSRESFSNEFFHIYAKCKKTVITKKEALQIKDFVDKVSPTTMGYMGERETTTQEKRKLDHFVGKVGEAGAFKILKTTPPDLTVYTSFDKSFSKDLIYNGSNLHVKSQHIIQSFRMECISWTFQRKGYSGVGHSDPILKSQPKQDQLACMLVKSPKMSMDEDFYEVYLCWLGSISQVIPEKLRQSITNPNKVCLYYGTLFDMFTPDKLE